MTTPNPEVTPNTAEVTAATQQAAAQVTPNKPAEEMTGKDFLEAINALPEKIVDALREAKSPASSAAATTTETTTSTTETTNSDPKGGFFGYPTFGDWFFGNK